MKLKEKLQSNRKYISNENLYETLICVIVFEKGKIIERKRKGEITWFERLFNCYSKIFGALHAVNKWHFLYFPLKFLKSLTIHQQI